MRSIPKLHLYMVYFKFLNLNLFENQTSNSLIQVLSETLQTPQTKPKFPSAFIYKPILFPKKEPLLPADWLDSHRSGLNLSRPGWGIKTHVSLLVENQRYGLGGMGRGACSFYSGAVQLCAQLQISQ